MTTLCSLKKESLDRLQRGDLDGDLDAQQLLVLEVLARCPQIEQDDLLELVLDVMERFDYDEHVTLEAVRAGIVTFKTTHRH